MSISICASFAVFEGVVERGEKFEPSLDSRIVVSHFADAFERLEIRQDAKLRAPEAASKALDGPDNATSFHVKRGPAPLKIGSSAADISDGPHGTVRLLLFIRSAKTVDERVAVHVEGGEPSATASQSGKAKIGGAASSARISRTTSVAGVNSNLTPLLRREVIG